MVIWNFSSYPQLITLQALTIKLSTYVYEAEIGASCQNKNKRLITMAVLFSSSAHRVVSIIKLLIQITIIKEITKPLGLESLFID